MEERKGKFRTWLGMTGVVILLTAFTLTVTGMVDLRIVAEMKVNKFLEYVIRMALFLMNIYFMLDFCCVDKNIKKHMITILIITMMASVYTITHLACSMIIPFLYVLVVDKKNLKRLIVFFASITIVQIALGIIKIGSPNYWLQSENILIYIIFSLDLYLMFIWMKGVELKYVVESSSKFNVFSKSGSIQCIEKDSKEILDFSELTKRQEVIFRLLASGYQIFQLVSVLAIGLMNNMILELIVMLIIFWNGREILGNCWHSKNLTHCSIATFAGFYILTKITPPFSISLFATTALCGMFTYSLYELGNKSDRLEELEEKEKNSREVTRENIERIIKIAKTKTKYQDYLLCVICDKMKDTDWFEIELKRRRAESNNETLDEQQYRRYKSKFTKICRENDILL